MGNNGVGDIWDGKEWDGDGGDDGMGDIGMEVMGWGWWGRWGQRDGEAQGGGQRVPSGWVTVG